MSMILSNLGPKTIYSDKGSEFNNADFLKLIFAIGHAPFVEAFNKTMKNRMYKYMSLYDIAALRAAPVNEASTSTRSF